MSLPKNRTDREFNKFEETEDGKVAVRVTKTSQDKDNQLEDSTTLDDLKTILTDIRELLSKDNESVGDKGIIRDGTGSNNKLKITERNQLVTAPISYSIMYPVSANVINTPFNILIPESGKNFVITDAILSTDKNIGAGGALVTVYESDGIDSVTEDKVIFQGEFLKNVLHSFIGLNMIVSEGKWVNIKTDDATVNLSIGGYYINKELT